MRLDTALHKRNEAPRDVESTPEGPQETHPARAENNSFTYRNKLIAT